MNPTIIAYTVIGVISLIGVGLIIWHGVTQKYNWTAQSAKMRINLIERRVGERRKKS